MELETRCQYKINGAHLQHLSNGILDLDDMCLTAVLESVNDDPPWTPLPCNDAHLCALKGIIPRFMLFRYLKCRPSGRRCSSGYRGHARTLRQDGTLLPSSCMKSYVPLLQHVEKT